MSQHAQLKTSRPTSSGDTPVEAESEVAEGFASTPALPGLVVAQRTAAADNDVLGGTSAAPEVADALHRRRGQGRPLDPDVASRFGEQLGADLSNVRVHADGEADQLARSVQSTAFTHGTDVYFTQGAYAPGQRSGDHLLAHELAHVVQQHNGPSAATSAGPTIGKADDPAEAAADATADRVLGAMRRQTDRSATLPAARRAPVAGVDAHVHRWFWSKKKKKDPTAPTTTPTTTSNKTSTKTPKGPKKTSNKTSKKKSKKKSKKTPTVKVTATATATTEPTTESTTSPEVLATEPTTSPEVLATEPTTSPEVLATEPTTEPTTEPEALAGSIVGVAVEGAEAVKAAKETFEEIIGTSGAPSGKEQAAERLAELKKTVKDLTPEEKKSIWNDTALMTKTSTYLGPSDYMAFMAAVGMAKSGGSVAHKSGAEVDSMIKQYLGGIAHLKDFIEAAIKAGKQAEGHIAVLDTTNWDRIYQAEFPSEAVGSKDETGTNAFTSTRHKDEPIVLNINRGNGGTGIHEGMHRYQKDEFLNAWGSQFNEGLTEYFTRRITDDPAVAIARKNYDLNLDFIKVLMPILGSDTVTQETVMAQAFFSGQVDGIKNLYIDWRKKNKSETVKTATAEWNALVKDTRERKWNDAKARCV